MAFIRLVLATAKQESKGNEIKYVLKGEGRVFEKI
jgi:hypothetical protein